MNVDRQQAIDFLVSLGFGNAIGWEDEKLAHRISIAHKKVEEEEVREEFEEFFESLCDHAGGKIELTGTAKAPKPETNRCKIKPKPEPEPPSPVSINGPATLLPTGKKKSPAKKKAVKKSSRPKVDKDDLGYRKGTLSAKVNAALSEDWQREAALVKKAGVTTAQARGHFYQLRDAGLLEISRVVSYRLKKKS